MKTRFKTYDSAVQFYRQTATLTLPRHLKDQLARAASSIALNLAEGSGRLTKQDQKHFYSIAFGSLRECQAILELASQDSAAGLANVLAAHLFKLIQSRS
jgi:four helix bundle protein